MAEYNPEKHVLGDVCQNGHVYEHEGQHYAIRYQRGKQACVDCQAGRDRRHRLRQPTKHKAEPDMAAPQPKLVSLSVPTPEPDTSRNKGGRPRSESESALLSLRVEPDVIERLDEACARLQKAMLGFRLSRSDIARRFIEQGLSEVLKD
jgi:hypothetical protein